MDPPTRATNQFVGAILNQLVYLPSAVAALLNILFESRMFIYERWMLTVRSKHLTRVGLNDVP